MYKLYLQNIVDDISFDNLPAKWQGVSARGGSAFGGDFVRFSKDKTFFDFQKQGLQNALKGLWLYFKENTPSANSPSMKGCQPKPDGVVADTPLQEWNIDIAETLSNLTGKWIKKVTPLTPLKEGNTPLTPLKEGNLVVEFEDGTKINTKDLDYKLIKPLIWWE